MLLVAERPGTCPVLKAPGPWDRAMAHIQASTLDSALARGASPDGTVRLALRARHLTGMRERRALARAIRHLVDQAGQPPDRRVRPVPVRWERVRGTAAELETMAGRLTSQAPVSARGVAQVSLLLRDGYGPPTRLAPPTPSPPGYTRPRTRWTCPAPGERRAPGQPAVSADGD